MSSGGGKRGKRQKGVEIIILRPKMMISENTLEPCPPFASTAGLSLINDPLIDFLSIYLYHFIKIRECPAVEVKGGKGKRVLKSLF